MQIKSITAKNKFQEVVIPMFLEGKLDDMMANEQTYKEIQDISLFDVKELYDLAYTKSSDSVAFKTIMAEAIKMDMAYRRQLKENTGYKGPYGAYTQSEEIKNTEEAA